MAIDQALINRLVYDSEFAQQLQPALTRAGFSIEYASSLDGRVTALYLKPNRVVKDIFSISREVLVLISEHPECQARDITTALNIIANERPRLSEELVLIFSRDPNTRQNIEEYSSKELTHFAGFSFDEVKKYLPIGTEELVQDIQARFFTKDLYFISTALTSASSFYGRRELVNDLSTQISRGNTHVGLFGLRKMGKTSLLLRLIEQIKNSKAIAYVHLDIQRIDAIRPTAGYLLWSIGQQLIDVNKSLRKLDKYRLFGKYDAYLDVPNADAIFELFDQDIRLILSETDLRIAIFIDEIELMSPETPGSQWGDSFVRFWRLLRGIDQQMQHRFRFFVTGTNPRCIETNKISDKENPTHNYFTRHFLSPFNAADAKELLKKIGASIGLAWPEESISLAFQYTGGHPFLLRAFASKIHKYYLPRSSVMTVTPDAQIKLVPAFLDEMSSHLSQMVEVLADYYQDEYYLLETLALGKIGEFSDMANAFPTELAHLVGYGLINPDHGSTGLNIELLQTWIQRRAKQRRSISYTTKHDKSLSRGDAFENYEIESLIGHEGGFAWVYTAIKINDPTRTRIVIKVLKLGTMQALQREIDVLTSLNHPNIVKILDHGRAVSGELYICMEYLPGQTLRQFCQRANRIRSDKLPKVMASLLKALISMHPNEERVRSLREKPDLSLEDLQNMELARHGYLHRDIKPENIIVTEDRGPVLIDFGISTKVGDTLKTVSATPGYLPPDGMPSRWTVDIDLYQLGLTLLQAAVGIQYDGENIDDLRRIAKQELPSNISNILLKLTNSERIQRYSSAQMVYNELRRYL